MIPPFKNAAQRRLPPIIGAAATNNISNAHHVPVTLPSIQKFKEMSGLRQDFEPISRGTRRLSPQLRPPLFTAQGSPPTAQPISFQLSLPDTSSGYTRQRQGTVGIEGVTNGMRMMLTMDRPAQTAIDNNERLPSEQRRIMNGEQDVGCSSSRTTVSGDFYVRSGNFKGVVRGPKVSDEVWQQHIVKYKTERNTIEYMCTWTTDEGPCRFTPCKNAQHIKRHIKSHLDIKTFECGFCHVKYSQRNGLTNHLRRKHKDESGIDYLVCPVEGCSETFCDTAKLSRHRSKIHKVYVQVHSKTKKSIHV